MGSTAYAAPKFILAGFRAAARATPDDEPYSVDSAHKPQMSQKDFDSTNPDLSLRRQQATVEVIEVSSEHLEQSSGSSSQEEEMEDFPEDESEGN